MIIQTKDLQTAANTILLAAELDKTAANLELRTNNNYLYLSVTNREYYVSVKFPIESSETYRAVVQAPLFLNLISGITTDEFELTINENVMQIKSGKSKYKLPMIFENNELMTLPIIRLENPCVEMTIGDDILKSILNVNSKEIAKAKNIDVNELQRLYYIDETGCFTFTSGACLNNFTLEKPVKLLLNDRIVKLFKLFNSDVAFQFGHDCLKDGSVQDKAVFQTENIYVAALLTCDSILIDKVQGPCTATKRLVRETVYTNKLVIDAGEMANAINRLLVFTKNSIKDANMRLVNAEFTTENNILTITDKNGNAETVTIENDSLIDYSYKFIANIADIKLILDSCKNEHFTMNYGNNRNIVFTHGTIDNVILESSRG